MTRKLGTTGTARARRGTRFEYVVRDAALSLPDAVYVMRSAGSRGLLDLVVFFKGPQEGWHAEDIPGPVWMVQVKRDGKLTKEERVAILTLGDMTHRRPVLAWMAPGSEGQGAVVFEDIKTKRILKEVDL